MSPFNNGYKRSPMRLFFGFLIMGSILVLLAGGVVMYLWNAILPSAAHFGTLTYWQAVGLLILCRILFGNFGKRGGGGRSFEGKTRMWREKWMGMSEEERQQFKEQWQKRCRTKE